MSNKIAIVILSDPKSGSAEEALGRVFNALGVAYDSKQHGDDVKVVFQGTGTRWLGELVKADNPGHTLYEAVKDKIVGASLGCATAFGALDAVKASGCQLVKDNAAPGTPGLASIASLARDGYQVLTF